MESRCSTSVAHQISARRLTKRKLISLHFQSNSDDDEKSTKKLLRGEIVKEAVEMFSKNNASEK